MTFLSGAKYRVGYVSDDFHIANMLYNIPVKKGAVIQHQILQCLDLLGPLGIARERYVLDCRVNLPLGSAERFDDFLDRNKLSSGGNKFVVINISNNKPATAWSEDNFIRLVNGLAGVGVRSVITAAPEDHAKTERIVSACSRTAVGYETPHVMDFTAAVKKASLLVCHDSGAMHIGAAAGTRTLVLIGRGITPAVWGPYGKGHKCLGRDSIADIGPEEVTKEAISMLEGINE
jgi:ADP-heptose:LPS heptosyltransferase